MTNKDKQSADEWLDKAWRGERCCHYKVVAEKYHELKLAEQPTREQIELELLRGIEAELFEFVEFANACNENEAKKVFKRRIEQLENDE